VGKHFRQHQDGNRMRAEHELFQGAVLEIGTEHAVQGQQGGQQGGNPDNPRTHGLDQPGIAADAQGKQAGDQDEEQQRIHQFGPAAVGEGQIPPQQQSEGAG
jgi:hypothetical protein